MATFNNRLIVATNAPTFRLENKYWSYAPYVKEMDLWFNGVRNIEIISPVTYPSQIFLKDYKRQDIKLKPIPFMDFRGIKNKLNSVLDLPVVISRLFSSFFRADHIHLRGPGNIGLLASLVQIFFPWKQKSAKYAGNWDPHAEQPWTYRLQKWILSNTFLTKNMQVLVYGEWPGQTNNVVTFFTASFSEKEIAEVPEKEFSKPFIFLFVGNLVEGKRPLEAVKLVEALNTGAIPGTDQEIDASSISARLEIFGNGPEKEKLEKYVAENQLEEFVSFKGSRPLEELKAAYQKAHFVILPSRSEGWPKAIAEGMFFGCIPIATPVSCVPWMLNYGSRGVLLEDLSQQPTANVQKQKMSGQRTEDRGQDVVKILQLLAEQEEMKKMSEAAKEWSQEYTLEKFELAIQEVLHKTNEKRIIETGKLSPAPFRDGVKRGKSEE